MEFSDFTKKIIKSTASYPEDIVKEDFLSNFNFRLETNNFNLPNTWYSASLLEGEVIPMFRLPKLQGDDVYCMQYSFIRPSLENVIKYREVLLYDSEVHDVFLMSSPFTANVENIVSSLNSAFVSDENFSYSLEYKSWQEFLGLPVEHPFTVISIYCSGFLFSICINEEQGIISLDSENWIDNKFEWAGDTQESAKIIETILLNNITLI